MSDKPGKKTAEHIFSSALEIDTSEERSAFLEQACGGDAALRAEVDELLRHDADAGSFLEKPPQELDATIQTDSSGESWQNLLAPSDVPGCLGTLGPYEVIELVGRGGMGVVLRGRDTKLNRIVAIKLLAPELAVNAVAVQRFLREAQAAAAVSHDHVVTIHAIDERAQPPVIVMEFVDGQSLQQKIDKEGLLDVKSILRIGMQTASGLAAAHRQGLVHRDIKPSNILLENGIERVKLTDFGLARAVDDIGVTRTGQITGTPQYMSPEQAQGQRIDHRTDLFSLGCVLYAMCTGRAAFRADSAVAVMHRVVHDAPRPIRELNEDIPEWLCGIVDKLLAKDAADRFESADDVEQLLGGHLAHLQQPDSAPQPSGVASVGDGASSRVDRRSERKKYFAPAAGTAVKRTFSMSELVILLAATLILLSSLARWHTSSNIGRFDGEQVSIGAVKLPDWRFGVTASQPPLTVWHSALAFREKASSDWFLEIPNTFLLLAAGGLVGLTVSRRFALLSPWAVIPLILLTAVYGVIHSGMVNCAILQELKQLRVPPLLIFIGFCLATVAILARLGAGAIRTLNTLAVDLQLRIAGYGLLLTGVAVIVYATANIISFLLILSGFVARQSLPSDASQVAVIFAICIAVLAAGVVVVHGGRAILKRTSITWAFVASLVGQPVGLWGLWILSRRDVRDLFDQHALDSRSVPGDVETG